MAPDVTDGLWLEGRGVQLAWYSTLEELQASTAPDFVTIRSVPAPPVTFLAWNDRVWSGLRCQVTTEFGGLEHAGPLLTGVRVVCWYPEEVRGLPAGFGWLQGQLVERFGPPGSFQDNGQEGRALWQLDRVTLRQQYFDGFGGGHEVLLFVSGGPAEPSAAAALAGG
jgi:hypothetical protein